MIVASEWRRSRSRRRDEGLKPTIAGRNCFCLLTQPAKPEVMSQVPR
jgi:hypothetical protein